MTYELAKKLKKAGFINDWCSEDDCSCLINGVDSQCFPNLSELIEACGENLIGMQKGHGGWDVIAWKNKVGADGIANIHEQAVTLEEAVARLWLELKKKDLSTVTTS